MKKMNFRKQAPKPKDDSIVPWCERHWKALLKDVAVNSHAATIELATVGHSIVTADHVERTPPQVQAAIKKISPICCHISKEALQRIFDVGRLSLN